MNDPRRDRKPFVAMGLAGSQFAYAGHADWAASVGMTDRMPGIHRHAGDRVPHIWEYAAKTNAIWAHQPMRQAPAITPGNSPAGGRPMRGRLIAAWLFRHLVAGRGDLGAILLQASQNGEVALVDHRAAEALHVAGAGLGSSAFRCVRCWAMALDETAIDNRREPGEIYASYSFISQQEIRFPNCALASPGRICLDGRRRVAQQRGEDKHR